MHYSHRACKKKQLVVPGEKRRSRVFISTRSCCWNSPIFAVMVSEIARLDQAGSERDFRGKPCTDKKIAGLLGAAQPSQR